MEPQVQITRAVHEQHQSRKLYILIVESRRYFEEIQFRKLTGFIPLCSAELVVKNIYKKMVRTFQQPKH